MITDYCRLVSIEILISGTIFPLLSRFRPMGLAKFGLLSE